MGGCVGGAYHNPGKPHHNPPFEAFGAFGANQAPQSPVPHRRSPAPGLFPPSEGEAYVHGMDVVSQMSAIRASIGYCPQHDVLWPDLTVLEHLLLFANIKGVPPQQQACVRRFASVTPGL